ncbi:MAG TPA: hydroxymethylglutaryl-CoA reductase [Longimicrobiaceae bacterium]|nr:hydroxymethylglutaryl-CoA reductase [Longimicrobiaceae bacterium]
MPISAERAREIAERLSRGAAPEALKGRLASTPPSERPVPPGLPGALAWSGEARDARIAFLATQGIEVPALAGREPAPAPEELRGCVEGFVGMTQVPTGVMGPLRVNGLHAHGDFYVPLATSEGALVASYGRGARLITLAGGAAAMVTTEQVQRAPVFVFETLSDAVLFAAWAVGEVERFREVAAARTRHGRLLDMMTHVEANHVYLIFAFHTGDAAGQNMVTFCTAAVCEAILAGTPVQPRSWFLESNMSGDKKATALSFLQTRGRNAMAEVVLPRALVERGLRTTPERMTEYWRLSFIGGVQTGSIGVSGHVANGIAALFLACGQDVACVSEASVGVTRMELTGEGDLYCAVTLPNLIVGTVGGGTRLPTARECLRMMDCLGEGRASKFAEICAATALGGEISIVGALCAGDFASAHERLGRTREPG